MKKLIIILFLTLSLSVLSYSLNTAYTAIPHLISYQGRLADSTGAPLNGSYNLTFRIYDAETGGNMLWEELQSGVVIQKGIFNILLGSVTDFNLAFDKPYWLEVKFGNEVMNHRQEIASSAYAIRAEKAEGVSGITNFFPTSGNVGVGTANPAEKLDINGAIAINGIRIIDNSGKWVGSPTNLIGPQGPTGPQGPAGPTILTNASCGFSSCRGTDMAMNACSILCNGASKVVTAQCGSCTVTSDTGSCTASNQGEAREGICCVCKP